MKNLTKEYNRLIDKLNAIERTRITDAKFLQVLINLDIKNAERAIELINRVGLNKAIKEAKQLKPFDSLLHSSYVDTGIRTWMTNWQIIAELGWGVKSTNYKKLGKKLKMLHPDKTEQVKTFVRAKQKILKEKLDEFADKNGDKRTYWRMGDDSFNDMTAHIVGLGKEKYSEVIKNPIVAKMIKYEESFLYVFHYC